MNDNFCPSHTVVELDTWERGPVFRHFIDDLRCVMSLTVDLEISRFLKQLSASGFRFYPAMIGPGDLPPPLSGGSDTVRRPGPLRPDGRAAQHL